MPNEDGTATDDQQQTGGPGDHQEQSSQQQTTPSPEDLRKAQENGQEKSSERYPEGERVEDLPDWAQRLIRQERSESASQRTARQQAEQAAQQQADERTRAILKAAGIDTGDSDEEDPAKLAEAARAEREKAEADAREARVELAVYRAAPGKNADAAALLDSRTFLQSLKDLDPTDSAAVEAAVEKAVQDNPKLAVTQAATRSGADFTGGNGDGALTPEKFKALSMQQRNELYFKDPDTYRRLAAH